MAYPDSYDEFRETENRPDVVYDPAQKKRLFAEDINQTTAALAAVQAILGLNPDDGWGTVAQFCKSLDRQTTDAYDYANQAYELGQQNQTSIYEVNTRCDDLDARIRQLGG